MTKKIELSQNKFALVDDEDYKQLSQWNWCAKECNGKFYAVRRKPIAGTLIRMHRQILDAPNSKEVDHINRNTLDNRKSNLRICTHKQNLRNQKVSSANTSGFKGVSWRKDIEKWSAYIKVNQKRIWLGVFEDKINAAEAYNNAALKYFGEFASLNDV